MTTNFVIAGDSISDTGNLDTLLNLLGVDPFEEPIYEGGGNVKPSDGRVVSEYLADLILGEQEEIIFTHLGPSATQLPLPIGIWLDDNEPSRALNLAYAGATSGANGSAGVGLEDVPCGVLSQAQLYAAYSRATGLATADDTDLFLSIGPNDLYDWLATSSDQIRKALLTRKTGDEEVLGQEIAEEITGNIVEAIGLFKVSGIDELAVLFLPPGETPFVQGYQFVDAFTRDRYPAQAKGAERTRSSSRLGLGEFLDSVTGLVQQNLAEIFNEDDSDGVYIVDGEAVLDEATKDPQAGYVDLNHPDDYTSSLLANLIYSDITQNSGFTSFGGIA